MSPRYVLGIRLEISVNLSCFVYACSFVRFSLALLLWSSLLSLPISLLSLVFLNAKRKLIYAIPSFSFSYKTLPPDDANCRRPNQM